MNQQGGLLKGLPSMVFCEVVKPYTCALAVEWPNTLLLDHGVLRHW